MMEDSLITIGLAFLEGLALIVSPCILPLLPVFLAGSLEGDKKRPMGVILGFILAFSLFTFFAKKIVEFSGIDLTIVRNVSFGLLIFLAIIMMSGYLTERFSSLMERIASWAPNPTENSEPRNDFVGGIIFGSLLGLIWTPCAGPILSAVILQTVIQKTTLNSFLTVLAFGVGVCVPMLLIVFLGRKFIATFSYFKQRTGLFRKILGIIIILSVFLMIYADTLTLTFSQTQEPKDSNLLNHAQESIINGLAEPYPAPPFEDIASWINTKPLQINDLKGKVVLVDFWAYSCINCIRTLPYLKSWYQKYQDQGLIIVGVHSPEFDFERNSINVKDAVEKFGILYPVALDNNFITWRNYHNQYWPASYLINKNGEVVYEHFGEGNYEVTESNIRYLLGLNPTKPIKEKQNPSLSQTPETYLGYERADTFSSPEASASNANQETLYSYPAALPDNAWALNGRWLMAAQKIVSASFDASIKINFNAHKVFAVMASQSGKPIKVKILLDGKPVSIDDKGEDVGDDSTVTVQQARLYHLISITKTSQGLLELTATGPGLELYTFTFGQ